MMDGLVWQMLLRDCEVVGSNPTLRLSFKNEAHPSNPFLGFDNHAQSICTRCRCSNDGFLKLIFAVTDGAEFYLNLFSTPWR